MGINPFVLVGHKNVHYVEDRTCRDMRHFAYVTAEKDHLGRTASYTLTFCAENVRVLYKQSELLQHVTYEQVKQALIVHEIAHIHADTLSVELISRDPVYEWLWNILVDSHDEHLFCRTYPSYLTYVQLVAVFIKAASPVQDMTPLAEALHTIFTMVRFGRVDPNADTALVNFILRCMFPAIRGSHQDTVTATTALYEYLKMRYPSSQLIQPDAGEEAMTTGELQQILDMEAIAGSDAVAIAEDLLHGQEPAGMDRSQGEPFYDDGDDSFYRAVTTTYASTIADLADRMTRYVNKLDTLAAYDGEMNLSMTAQQQAYEASYTGEEARVYILKSIQQLLGAIVVVQDVSGSTGSVKERYAAACVIFLAAFERITTFKRAYVVFNNDAYEIAGFDDDLSQSAIKPRASGGTLIGPALDITDSYAWAQESINIRMVITDGGIDDFAEEYSRILELQERCGVFTFLIEIVTAYKGSFRPEYPLAFQSTLEDLPEKMTMHVVALLARRKNLIER